MSAFIFDMDGCLLDSIKIWHEAEQHILDDAGVVLSKAERDELNALTLDEAGLFFHERFGILGDGAEVAQAIIDYRSSPSASTADKTFYKEEDYGSFKDFSDLQTRIQEKTNSEIGNEAANYLIYAPEMYFEVTIVGASAGISHTVKAVAMVQDGKVRYIRWQEDP